MGEKVTAIEELLGWVQGKAKAGISQVRVSTLLPRAEAAAAETRLLAKAAKAASKNGKTLIGPDDLVSAAGAARLLDVDATRPSKWRQNGTTFGPDKITFPKPFAVFGATDTNPGFPIFLRAEVLRLKPFVDRRRRPSRRGVSSPR